MPVTKVKLKVFGAARDIMGGREVELDVNSTTVGALRTELLQQFPALGDLKSLLIAINQKYANDESLINETDEIAVIPPVSGG